eukprot:3574136-Pyramimonas_sp.AAC.1
MYTSEHCPNILDAAEVIVTDHSDSEPNETLLPKTKVITKEWASVESKHTCNSDTQDDDKEFLCGEKVPQFLRRRWIQPVVMARNGCAHSRTDNVAMASNEEL